MAQVGKIILVIRYKEGQTIGKFKVKKINKDSVILIKNGKESKLNLK